MKMRVLSFILFVTQLSAEPIPFIDLQKNVLSESPRIRAMEQESRMMKSRMASSGALDDPKLKLGVNNLPTDSFSFKNEDMTSKEIGISQMIPAWGKLSLKERISVKEYQKSLEKLRKEKSEFLHILRMNVYELSYLRSSIAILEEIKKQLRLVIDSEVAANKAGMGSISNVIKANIEFTMVDEEIINLRQKEKDSIQQINYIAGKKIEAAVENISDLKFIDLNRDEIFNQLPGSNPDVRMAKIDIDIAHDEVSLKKREYIPDVELGLSYMQRDSGSMGKRSDMITGMVTLNLPLWFWKKNMPMVDEMKKKAEAGEMSYKDKLNEKSARLLVLFSQMDKWKDLYILYSKKIIPQAELALEANLSRYRTSAVEFMPVVDTMRMLLKYKKELLMAKKEYYVAYSEIHAMMGREIVQ